MGEGDEGGADGRIFPCPDHTAQARRFSSGSCSRALCPLMSLDSGPPSRLASLATDLHPPEASKHRQGRKRCHER